MVNIVASLVIQNLIKKHILSYHKEIVEKIDYKNKIVKTNNGIYTDDLIIFLLRVIVNLI